MGYKKKEFSINLDEHVNVSDSVTATVVRRVIIPKFSKREPEEDYFVPAIKEVVRGDYVEWVNLDTRIHYLRFYDTSKYKVLHLFGFKIGPKQSHKVKFNFNISRIDYYCSLHTKEIGSIVTYSESDRNMTNTEQFRYLSRMFNIKPPDFLKHLGSG